MLLSNLEVVLTFFAVVWVASLIARDASIVDRFWGIAFVVIATATSAATDGYEARARLVVTLTALWGLRLSWHITMRNLGRDEDFRYQAMRRRWGRGFPMVSLVTVFALQAVLAWGVSLPVQVAVAAPAPRELTLLDALGVLVWMVGFFFETVGDFQLAEFRARPSNEGKVLNRGLWRYTRHPNYFGDAVQWWGLWLFAAATGAWWTAIGPAMMTLLLMRVSGVSLLERHLRKSRPGYDEYVKRTSAFVPMSPRALRQSRDRATS